MKGGEGQMGNFPSRPLSLHFLPNSGRHMSLRRKHSGPTTFSPPFPSPKIPPIFPFLFSIPQKSPQPKNTIRATYPETSITFDLISKSIKKYQYSREHSFWGRGLEGKKKENRVEPLRKRNQQQEVEAQK